MYVCDEPQLQVTLSTDERGMPVVSAFGEIDLHSVGLLDTLLLRGVFEAGRAGCLVVDLRGVEFLDILGLRALMRARNRLRSASGDLVLVCDGQVRWWLETTGFSKEFDLFPNIKTASQAA